MVDLVCVMTVNPGFGGQSFIESQVSKIARLRAMIGDRPVHIEIDGEITTATAPLVAKVGADVLVAGSAPSSRAVQPTIPAPMAPTSGPFARRPRRRLADRLNLIFDLDGTLIDSAPQIHAAANIIFQDRGLPPFLQGTVRGCIGNGVGVLVSRLMAHQGLDENAALHAELVARFIHIYEEAFDPDDTLSKCIDSPRHAD